MEFEQAQKGMYDYINRMRDSLAVYAKKPESKQSEIDKRNANIKQLTEYYNAFDLKIKQLNDNVDNLKDVTVDFGEIPSTEKGAASSMLERRFYDKEQLRKKHESDTKLNNPNWF